MLPAFPYYVVNGDTWFVVAGFDMAFDGQRFIDAQLHPNYKLVTKAALETYLTRTQGYKVQS